MIIDGRTIAADILTDIHARLSSAGISPTLRAVVVQPSLVTESYLSTKSAQAERAGMQMEIIRLSESATEEDVIAAIEKPGADAIIVQLPLPEQLQSVKILSAIPISKDADVLSSAAYDRFVIEEPGALLPPVTESIKEVLERSVVEIAGKRVVVVGDGKLVGRPAALWLASQSANVSVITLESGDWAELAEADIVVLGAGSAGLVTKEQLKQGVVLIDAGTTESSGSIAGDADPACAEVASIFTPVPGGIGPISVACLFKNAAELSLRNRG